MVGDLGDCGKCEVQRMRYYYGMRLRPFAPFCQPMKGLLDHMEDAAGTYWDILIYSRPLTEKEMRDYELDFLRIEDNHK